MYLRYATRAVLPVFRDLIMIMTKRKKRISVSRMSSSHISYAIVLINFKLLEDFLQGLVQKASHRMGASV